MPADENQEPKFEPLDSERVPPLTPDGGESPLIVEPEIGSDTPVEPLASVHTGDQVGLPSEPPGSDSGSQHGSSEGGKEISVRYDEEHPLSPDIAETDPTSREMYVFEPERFDAETVERIQRELEIRQGNSWRVRRIRELVDEREVERKWAEEFSGKIPLNWVEVQAGPVWFSIMEDIKEPDFELTDSMVTAAIKHPVTHVVDTLVTQRRLTPEQMRLVESQEGIPHWVIEEMREAQPKLVPPVTDSESAS